MRQRDFARLGNLLDLKVRDAKAQSHYLLHDILLEDFCPGSLLATNTFNGTTLDGVHKNFTSKDAMSVVSIMSRRFADQLPILPPSSFLITMQADCGRPPALPSGQELNSFGSAGSLRVSLELRGQEVRRGVGCQRTWCGRRE